MPNLERLTDICCFGENLEYLGESVDDLVDGLSFQQYVVNINVRPFEHLPLDDGLNPSGKCSQSAFEAEWHRHPHVDVSLGAIEAHAFPDIFGQRQMRES